MDIRKRGATSQMVRVFIPDNSVTTGAACTGLVYNSTNLSIAFMREFEDTAVVYTGANIEDITAPGTYQAPSSSSKCRFKAVDATNFPGLYEVHVHNDAVIFTAADASEKVIMSIREATTTALKIGPNMKEIQLVAINLQDTVRAGLTALPNAAADGVGGLPISDAGGLDLDTKLANTNEVTTARMGALTDWIDAGRLDLILDSVLAAAGISAAYSIVNSGVGFRGTVTAADPIGPPISFTVGTLVGIGAGAFTDPTTPWYAYVFRDAGGLAGAPQGEVKKITAYNSATGVFQTDAFTAPVNVGDDVIIQNPRLADIKEIKAVTDKFAFTGASPYEVKADVVDWKGAVAPAMTGDSYAVVNSLTYGNSALKTLIDAVAGYLDTEIGDIRNRLPAALTLNGNIKCSLSEILTTALTETLAGYLAAGFKKLFDIAVPAMTMANVNQSGDAYARLGAPVLASVSADIAAINTALALIAPLTDAADAATLTTGSTISGTYVNTQTDDDVRYVLAPVNPGGLSLTLDFAVGLGRATVALTINGYFNGSGQICNVYAYDYILGVWDQLSNSSTRMGSRNSDANYSYPLNREHIDPDTGNVSIKFVSTSTNTAHRLNLDRVLVATVDSSTGASPSVTAQDIWTFWQRTLTGTTGEPASAAEIATAIGTRIAEAQGSYSYDQILSLALALLAGVTADHGATFKTPNGAVTRAAATVNGDNERTAMVLTP
jgi:hypothetical protein